MSNAKRAGSREERQAHSSNTLGLRQSHSLGAAHNSPADVKAASSHVKVELQSDAVSSPGTEQKPGNASAAPAEGQLENEAAPISVPAATQDNTVSVQVKVQTDTVQGDVRPEPGEISNAAGEGGQKEDEGQMANGSGLAVKLAVRVKGDGAVGGSPLAVLPELRLRDRYVWECIAGLLRNWLQQYLYTFPTSMSASGLESKPMQL